jgi:23S rRNA-/tRNA-specific pseudouridylate synthase
MGPSQSLEVWECEILLHSGRTHQIRAQFAAIGAPLLGDVMYGPLCGVLVGESGVLSPHLVPLVEQMPSLSARIGLHSWRLDWKGQTFEAAPDWDVSRA